MDEGPARARTSHRLLSGSSQWPVEELQQRQLQIPGILRGGQPRVAGQVQPVGYLPPGVEPVLPGLAPIAS